MNRVTVQYRVNGQYGEFVAKSDTLTADEMVSKMRAEAKPGIAFRFLNDSGVIHADPEYATWVKHQAELCREIQTPFAERMDRIQNKFKEIADRRLQRI